VNVRFVAALVLVVSTLACAGAEPPPAECPEAPECPAPQREIVVVPVFDDGKAEHWCCAYDQDGARRYALVDGPTACRTQFGSTGGSWTEGNECIPCCCRTPVSETDASKGAVYEVTSPVACAGVGECVAGDPAECGVGQPGPGKAKVGKGKGKKGG
jgi:hypothetical protein